MAKINPPRTPNIPPEILPLRARQFRLPKTFAALRHRNFRLFLLGQLMALAGTWMQIIAQGWLVYELSGSELMLGVVGFASAIPALVISPWGGVVTDRMSRRKLLIITQVGTRAPALVLAGLTFAGVVEVWHVIVLAVVLGVVNAFDGPARQAFVVEMVGRDDLPNAIAMNSMSFNLGRIVGPAVGGVMLVTVGAGWCFLVNGLSVIPVVISLVMMVLPAYEPKTGQLSPWQQLRGGLSYVRHSPVLRALLLLSLLFSLFGITYGTVLPAFVDKVLNADAAAFGALNAMSGIGAVTAAFLVARYGDRGQRGRWLAWALMGFPLVLMLFAVTSSYWVSLVLSGLLGVGFMFVYTLLNTLLQTNLVDEMRGRVLSLYTLTFFGFTPFGNLLVGAMSESFGLSIALLTSAAACLVFGGAVLLWTPAVQRLP